MIYTLTLNPALDYVMNVTDIKAGQVCRSDNEEIYPGGKGINVSTVLTRFGVENTALGIAAGFTGGLYLDMIKTLGITADFVTSDSGFTRINVKVRHKKSITELNGEGSVISNETAERLFSKINPSEGDYMVLAGSVPKSESTNIYEEIFAKAKRGGAKIVVDAAGDLLINSLRFKPFLIKPNAAESAEILGYEPKTHNEAVKAALKFRGMGALNVLLSLGEKGAVLLSENEKIYKQSAPRGKVVNTVGAGDSMLAGFLAGYLRYRDYGEALRFAVAAGSAAAFSAHLATAAYAEALYLKLQEAELK